MCRSLVLVLAVICTLATDAVAAVPKQITVQGKLTDPLGNPQTGSFTFEFRIFNASTGGAQIWPNSGSESHAITTDSEGLWTEPIGVTNALTDAVFADTVRWLELTVAGETLSRIRLVTGPFAYRVATVDGATGGTITTKLAIGVTNINSGTDAFVAGDQNVASGVATSVVGGSLNTASGDRSFIGGGRSNDASGASSLIGAGEGNNSFGPHSVVGGGAGNTAFDTASVVGGTGNWAQGRAAFIGSGLYNLAEGYRSVVVGGERNSALSAYSFIGGGYGHRARGVGSVVVGGGSTSQADSNVAAGNHSFVGGGYKNLAAGDWSVIIGGGENTASSMLAFLGGGGFNAAMGSSSVVAGGYRDSAMGDNSFVGGGVYNRVRSDYGAIVGGLNNVVDGPHSFVGGGSDNNASDSGAVVAGGSGNAATGRWAFVGAGEANRVTDSNSVIGGGQLNVVDIDRSAIVGGDQNEVHSAVSFIGGGTGNEIALGQGGGAIVAGFANIVDGFDAFIGAGFQDTASGNQSVVCGGLNNDAIGDFSFVGGGDYNRAGGNWSCIPGGGTNAAMGEFSFAAGLLAKANHDGSVVIAANDFSSTADSVRSGGVEQMVLRADGGIYLTNASGLASIPVGDFLNTSTGAHLTSGGVWTNSSDKYAKENFTEVDCEELLISVSTLPITRWNYKLEDESITHIGPVAQDFHALFAVGTDDKSISTIDPAGIALAAIQALYKRNQELEATVEELKSRLGRLETK